MGRDECYPAWGSGRGGAVSVRRLSLIAGLVGLLAAAALFSLTLGRFPVPAKSVADILLSQVWAGEIRWTRYEELAVLNVRGPRVLAAMLVGAALAVAGASYQSLFRNPLAAPDILGVTAGSGFGASLALLLGLGPLAVQAFAFASGLLAVGLCFALGTLIRQQSMVMLLLSGIIVAACFNALLSILKIVADPVDVLPVITFWLLGGLNRVTPGAIPPAFGLILASLAVMAVLRWQVTVLASGAEEARAMGVRIGLVQFALVLAATLMTAAAVGLAGTVGWVGLIVPHMARLVAGGGFDRTLPVAALLGALFLLVVDDICRSADAMEVPLSIVTALVGAPLFALLLYRQREDIA